MEVFYIGLHWILAEVSRRVQLGKYLSPLIVPWRISETQNCLDGHLLNKKANLSLLKLEFFFIVQREKRA